MQIKIPKIIPIVTFVFIACATSSNVVLNPSEHVRTQTTFSRLLYTTIDLNDDKIQEEFIAAVDLCGTGGCEWYIFEKVKDRYRFLGTVFGKKESIRVLPAKQEGYHRLRMFHKMSAFDGVMVEYEFHRTEYKEILSKDITSTQYLKYFK